MLLLFLLAGFLTVLLSVVIVGGLVAGLILFFVRPLRFLAPFVTFIPPSAALGAAGASWGAAELVNQGFQASGNQTLMVLPFYAWIIGLPVGGILGGLIGLGLALFIRKRLPTYSVKPNVVR